MRQNIKIGILAALAAILLVALAFGGAFIRYFVGNKQILDLTYDYSYAILKLPDGRIVEGKVQSWNDYEGDSVQIKINGRSYYVHMSNAVLMTD